MRLVRATWDQIASNCQILGLKSSFWPKDFRTLKLSNLESFRVLKASNLAVGTTSDGKYCHSPNSTSTQVRSDYIMSRTTSYPPTSNHPTNNSNKKTLWCCRGADQIIIGDTAYRITPWSWIFRLKLKGNLEGWWLTAGNVYHTMQSILGSLQKEKKKKTLFKSVFYYGALYASLTFLK